MTLLLQNSANVNLRFLHLRAQMPLFAVIMLSALFGAGILWFARRRR
ncbi:LapA family protein [Coraliomargarita sinensis]